MSITHVYFFYPQRQAFIMSNNANTDNIVTNMRHNDYVGGDASMGRIPGAEQAATGHQYVSVFPKGE